MCNLVVCASLSIISCWLIDPVYGFYDSFGAALMSGSITEAPITQTFHLGLYPISKLIGFLHSLAPALPWSGIMILLCWITVQTIFITLFSSYLYQGKFKLLQSTLLWLLSTSFAMGFSLVEFSGTGIGILLSFIAVVGLWYTTAKMTGGVWQYLAVSFFTFVFFAGMAWRIESGVGGALIAGCFVVSVTTSFKRLFYVFVLPALVSTLMVFNLYFLLQKHAFFRKVEPLVYYVTDSRNPPPLIATDSIDDLRLRMARASFLIDTAVFNYELFDRMANEKADYEKQLIATPSKIVVQMLSIALPTITENFKLTLLYLLLFTCCVYVAATSKIPKSVTRLVLFNGGVWLIIAVAAYTMKMEKWHYVPILQCTTLGNFLLGVIMPRSAELFSRNRFKIIVVGACALGFLFLAQETTINKKIVNEKIAMRKEVFTNAGDKLMFLDVNSREVLDNYVFRLYTPMKNVVLYDMAQIPFLPQYENQLNELCACNSHDARQFFSFLKKNTDRIHYLSTPYRVQYLQDFSKHILKMPVLFIPVHTFEMRNLRYGAGTIINYKMVFE